MDNLIIAHFFQKKEVSDKSLTIPFVNSIKK